MGEAFRRFASNIVDFFAALLYWLLFGKIGLLKKLFRRNSKGK